jgi:hypothetical protein
MVSRRIETDEGNAVDQLSILDGMEFHYFKSDCGHEWIAPHWGSWACPYCGRYDGNGHLREQEDVVDFNERPVELVYASLAAFHWAYTQACDKTPTS